tara:strand:- start:98 stop:439 length:342 start_codon:yes stop_codon:yes gene_type:complete
MATGIINFLRGPQSFFLFINIGDNQYEGQLLGIRIFDTMNRADEYVNNKYRAIPDRWKVVKVKTDINQLTESFFELFSGGRKDIIDLQRYRIKDIEGISDQYMQTMYIFEVKK